MNDQPAIVANICERFAMTLKPEPGDEWFLDWVLHSPNHVSTHLTAGWHAYNAVKEIYRGDEIKTAYECFGGMGAQALMIERLFNLDSHVVCDYTSSATDHLERELQTWKPHLEVRIRDAYSFDYPVGEANLGGHWGLVGLDFGDLTAWKTRDGEPHRVLLDQVFSKDPKAVVITDIACRYLHLHRERYEGLLGAGTCGSYDTYLDALAGRLQALYGYGLVAGFKDRWSTVFTLVPQDLIEQPGFFHPTPKTPVGLELL